MENKIIESFRSGDINTVNIIKNELLVKKSILDYTMHRFLEDFESKLDDYPYSKLYKDKTNEYSELNRYLRIIDAYSQSV